MVQDNLYDRIWGFNVEIMADVGDGVKLGSWAKLLHFLIDGTKFWICGADNEMKGNFGLGKFGPE